MQHVELTFDGPIALVRLNRPPVNALSEALAHELEEAFEACRPASIRSVVVTGQPHFAAGADIKGFKAAMDAGDDDREAGPLRNAIEVLESLDKPTIAAIHGYALGGGCELSLGCDFRYMATDAKIGQPEILLGIIPGAGGTQRLQRLIGFQAAKDLVYTGRHVGADEALTLGFADRVLPTDEVLGVALEDAGEWATKATAAIGAAKRALSGGRSLAIGPALELEANAFNESFATEDAKEGVDAFVEKRAPEFKGR